MGRLLTSLTLILFCCYSLASHREKILPPGLYFDRYLIPDSSGTQRTAYVMLLLHSKDINPKAELAVILTPVFEQQEDMIVLDQEDTAYYSSLLYHRTSITEKLFFRGPTWFDNDQGTVDLSLEQRHLDHLSLAVNWRHPSEQYKNVYPHLVHFKLHYFIPLVSRESWKAGQSINCQVPPATRVTRQVSDTFYSFQLIFHPDLSWENTNTRITLPWRHTQTEIISTSGVLQTCDGVSLVTSHDFAKPANQRGLIFSFYNPSDDTSVIFGSLMDQYYTMMEPPNWRIFDILYEWYTQKKMPEKAFNKTDPLKSYVFFPAQLKEEWKIQSDLGDTVEITSYPDVTPTINVPPANPPSTQPSLAQYGDYRDQLNLFFSLDNLTFSAATFLISFILFSRCIAWMRNQESEAIW